MSRHRLARATTSFLVATLALGIGVAPRTWAGPATDYAAIDAHALAMMEAWGAPGLSLGIARDGEVVHTAAFGVAGPGGRTMTTQTPVVIGSVGKSLTALAVRQLVDQGAIELSAPVTRYLPWFRLDAPDAVVQAVTIERLLTHTSGLSTASGQDPDLYVPGLTMAEVVASMAGVRPDRAAGTYEYCNLNFVILGVVIEAVAGQSYGDYLATHVFGPLGMTNSATSPTRAGLVAPAQGHRYLLGLATPFDEPFPTGMVAAGFQLSSAADMARYVAALANGGALGAVVVAGPPVGTASRPRFGTDWQPVPAGSASNQSGATLSTNANILTLADERLAVVVLVNANPIQLLGLPAGASDLALDIARMAGSGSGPAAAGPPSVRLAYLAVDAILLALALLLAVHVWRAPSWARRLADARRRWWFIGRTLIADAILPLSVLIGLPLLIGATGSSPAGDVLSGWRFLLWTLPDLAVAVAVLCTSALLVGAFKLASTVRTGRRPAPLGRTAFSAG